MKVLSNIISFLLIIAFGGVIGYLNFKNMTSKAKELINIYKK